MTQLHEIEVAKHQSKQIRPDRKAYRETEKCRLLSYSTTVVVLHPSVVAEAASTGWQATNRQPRGNERDLVRVVDRLSVESHSSRLVWRVQ